MADTDQVLELVQTQQQFHDGIALANEILEKTPDDHDAAFLRALAYACLGEQERSLALYQAMLPGLKDHPSNYTNVLNNIAGLLTNLHRYEEAQAVLEQIAHLPHQIARINQAQLYIGTGRWLEGWQLYRARGVAKVYRTRHSTASIYRAQTLNDILGRHVLFYHEFGLGDGIQFLRYAQLLQPLVPKLTIGVPAALQRLARNLLVNNYQVIVGHDAYKDEPYVYDCEVVVPFLDAPVLFANNSNAVPNEPYIAQMPYYVLMDRCISAYCKSFDNPRVGLCWAGNARPDDPVAAGIDRRRSLPIEALEPILELHRDFDFVSLQQPAKHVNDKRIAQPIRDAFDMLDTAAIISQLDLVIACDSAMAHLAAALGKPTWLLSRYDGCWRWFYDDRTDSPWYPSMRLYRQPRAGDWASVIDRVVRDLERLNRGLDAPAS